MPTPKDKKESAQLELLKAHKAQLVSLQKETTLDTLKAIEDKVLEDSVNVVIGVLGFADMGFDESGKPVVPDDWQWLNPEDRAKRIRLATMGNMPSSDIPHGVKLAHATMLGIIKARAQVASGDKTLNIENAVFPAPAPLVQEVPAEEIVDVED